MLLAEMQERFCYLTTPERIFTIADLRGLLKLKKHRDNDKAIINGLIWLQKLNLIDYTITETTTNLGTKRTIFNLVTVNYYTNGGEAIKYLNSTEEKLSEEIKNSLLNSNVVVIFED